MRDFSCFNSLNASLFAIILFKKIKLPNWFFTSSALDSPIVVSKWIYIRYFPSHGINKKIPFFADSKDDDSASQQS
jgi:hypothetical protein